MRSRAVRPPPAGAARPSCSVTVLQRTRRENSCGHSRNRPAEWLFDCSRLQREVVVDHHRRVIREALLEVDVLAQRLRRDARRREVIVKTPADVLRPRLAAVAPPGVLLRVRVEGAEHVDEADLVERVTQPRALFGQEAAVLLIALPVLQVDFLVRDVDVAHQDELALALERTQMRAHQREKAVLRLLPLLAAGAARKVAADDAQLALWRVVAQLDIAAFGVELGLADALLQVARLVARVQADTR